LDKKEATAAAETIGGVVLRRDRAGESRGGVRTEPDGARRSKSGKVDSPADGGPAFETQRAGGVGVEAIDEPGLHIDGQAGADVAVGIDGQRACRRHGRGRGKDELAFVYDGATGGGISRTGEDQGSGAVFDELLRSARFGDRAGQRNGIPAGDRKGGGMRVGIRQGHRAIRRQRTARGVDGRVVGDGDGIGNRARSPVRKQRAAIEGQYAVAGDGAVPERLVVSNYQSAILQNHAARERVGVAQNQVAASGF